MKKRTLCFYPSGLLIIYEIESKGEFIHIADLNPEQHIRVRLFPHQLFLLGFWCIWRSIFR